MQNNKRVIGATLVIILLGLFGNHGYLSAQALSFKQDSIVAENWLLKAMIAKENQSLDSCLVFADQSAKKFRSLGLWEKWYDSQYEVYLTLLNQEKHRDLLRRLQYDMDQITPQIDDVFLRVKVNDWLGHVYYNQGQYGKALSYYLNGIKTLEEAGNPDNNHGSLIRVGIIYTMQSEYNLALSYLERAEFVNLNSNNGVNLYYVYYNLGLAYQAFGNYDKAIDSFNKWLKFGGNEIEVSLVLSEIYRDKGNLQEALRIAKKAMAAYSKEGWNKSEVLTLIGSIYQLEKKYNKALSYSLEALSYMAEASEFSDRELGKAHIQIADIYCEMNRFLAASEHYEKALDKLLSVSYDSEDPLEVSLKNIDLANGVWIMEALMGKGLMFQKQYAIDDDIDFLINSINCYEVAFNTIEILRTYQIEEATKAKLIDYAHPIYEKAMQGVFTMYKTTANQSYIDQAFTFSQKTKAFLVTSALQNMNALENGEVPDSLIRRERMLKQSILDAQQEMVLLKGQSRGDSNMIAIKAEMFDYKRRLQKLKDYLEGNYPQYYHLKYANKTVSIDDVRNLALNKNTALLDFFMGENSIFIFTITEDYLDLQEIERTESLDNAIEQFIFQSGNSDFITNSTINYQKFTTSAGIIFQNLLKESLSSLSSDIDQLIIIPDGNLSMLPFEALLTKQPNNTQPDYSFQNLSYLIENYTISYHYSPFVLLKEKQKLNQVKAPNLFAGFAPEFSQNDMIAGVRSCSGESLPALKYNQIEVNSISKLFKGEVFLNKNANLNAFQETLNQYRILHLATHACMNDEDPLNHKIFFADEEFISTRELYNMPINAEMVVLSACETGTGEVVRGEGVISLARGFSYAGCPSVIMSLWSVPDKSSSEIMVQFYNNLYNGLSKDKSLRQAKLDFTKTQKSNHQHPFYWAAFVPIGDAGVLELNSSVVSSASILMMSFIILFVLAFSWFRKM